MNWQATCFETPDLLYIVPMVDMNVRAQMEWLQGSQKVRFPVLFIWSTYKVQ